MKNQAVPEFIERLS